MTISIQNINPTLNQQRILLVQAKSEADKKQIRSNIIELEYAKLYVEETSK
jgi:hypothetical protein